MAALLAIPIGALIEASALTAGIAEGVGALVGSEAVGTAAGGLVSGTIANELAQAAVPTTVEKSFEQGLADVMSASKALYFNDPKFLVGRSKGVARPLIAPPSEVPKDIPVLDKANTDPPEIPDSAVELIDSGLLQDSSYSAKDIVKIANYVGKSASTDEPFSLPKKMHEFASTDNYYTPLTETIVDYLSENKVKKSEEYQKISEVYDLNNVSIANNFVMEPRDDGRYDVYFIDEVGVKNGPMRSNKPGDYFIPPIYSQYGGAQSPNGAYNGDPTPTDIVDLAFAAHDIGYAVNDYFSYEEDLKLVSRLNSLLERGLVPADQIGKIKNIILYFTTAGTMISAIKGNDQVGQIPEISDDGIFGKLVDKESMPEEIYQMEKYKFYNEMDKEYSNAFSSINASLTEDILKDEIGSLLVQIV